MSEVPVAAIGDIHSPRYLKEFKEALARFKPEKVDLLLLAGDIVNKGRVEEYPRVLEALKRKGVKCPIVACFGNEEYDEKIGRLRRMCGGEVLFLDDEKAVLEVKGIKIGIVGSRGSLDKPTVWQARNIPGIERLYRERVKKVARLRSGHDGVYI